MMVAIAEAPSVLDAARYSENSRRHLICHTHVLTRRLLVRQLRNTVAVVNALILPVAALLALNILLGDSVTSVTGVNGLYRFVPLAGLMAAISGSTGGLVGVIAERQNGFLARIWVLPVHRAAGLLSRLVAEAVRLFVTTVTIAVAGILLGFRFHCGVAAAVLWLTVPVIFGIAFSAVVTLIALYWSKAILVESIQAVGHVGAFFCTGLVPLKLYPDWVQPFVKYQPMSTAVDAMRGLSVGGPVLMPMVTTLLWSAGTLAVCLLPILVGYRKASTSR
jgi:ABC-2 type transport system permease protein